MRIASVLNTVKIFNTIGLVLLVYIWFFTAINIVSLPKIIPLHFNLDGKADAYGSRFWIFVLPLIAAALFYLMKYVARQKEAKMQKESPEMNNNRRISNVFAKIILIYLLLLVADITTESILIAKGHYETLSGISTLLVFMMMISIVGFFLYAKNKIQEIH